MEDERTKYKLDENTSRKIKNIAIGKQEYIIVFNKKGSHQLWSL